MADYITIAPAGGTWVLLIGGTILGESTGVLELREGDYAPVLYVPRADIAMEFFDKSETSTHCPHKGDASYYSYVSKNGEEKDIAWSYEEPLEQVAGIKDYLAFYPDRVKIARR